MDASEKNQKPQQNWIPACAGVTSKSGRDESRSCDPACAGMTRESKSWMPAFAGMTRKSAMARQAGSIALSAARAASNEKCELTLTSPFADKVFHNVSSA